MATTESLRARTRLELGDESESFRANVTGDGVTTRYELPVNVVDPVTVSVFINTDPVQNLADPADYTLEARRGFIVLNAPVTSGDQLVITGNHFRFFTDAQVDAFVTSAFAKHTVRNNDVVAYADLPEVEEHLVAIMATIEALWTLATDTTYDIDILSPEGVSIPRTQRFQQIMQLIAQQQERYEDIAEQLNVGLKRIEMFNLRRVSRLTNRLVPVYKPQEYDDTTTPVRVYPPIDELN